MRKLTIEKMEEKTTVKKVDTIVGSPFERSTEVKEMNERMEEIAPQSIGGWSHLICF